MAHINRPSVTSAGIAVALAAGFAAIGLALATNPGAVVSGRGTVEVTGNATVVVRPNTLTVDLSVRDVASTSSTALARNNTQMADLQAVFRQAGVPTKDLATTNLSVGQNFDSNGKPAGYAAEDDLTVTLANLSRAGTVLSAAQTKVGNSVSITSTTYSLSDTSNPINSARADAVRHAHAAAAAIAGAAGEHIDGIVKISDQTSNTPPIGFNAAAGFARQSAPSSSVPLQSGTQTVSATVDIVYSVN